MNPQTRHVSAELRQPEVNGFFGGYGGHGVGEFSHIHSIATDSKGNVYLGEVDTGRRVYRWSYKGLSAR